MWLHTGNASIASVLAALFSTSLALAQPTLIDQLDDPHPARSREAANRLGRQGKLVIPELTQAFELRNRHVIRHVIRALVRIGQPAWPTIERGASHDNPFVRLFALQAIANRAEAAGLEELVRARLEDPDPLVREQAAASLTRYTSHQTYQALCRATRDREPGVRQEALRSLGQVARRSVPEEVLDALADPVQSNRLAALETLRRLDPRLRGVPGTRRTALASTLLEAGHTREAGQLLLQADPKDHQVQYLLGVWRHARGEPRARDAAFAHAMRLAPGYARPRQFQVQRQLESGDLAAARETLSALLRKPDRRTLWLQVRCAELSGRTSDVLGALRRLLSLHADDLDATIELARQQFRAENYEMALPTLRRWVSRQPYRVEAHNLLGLTHKHAGRLAAAERAFKIGLEHDSRSPALLYNLGVLYDDKLIQPKKALRCFRRYLAIGGKNPDVPAFVATIEARLAPGTRREMAAARGLAEQGFDSAALIYLRKVLARKPRHPDASRMAGQILLRRRQGLAALRHLTRVKNTPPATLERAIPLITRPLELKEAAALLFDVGRTDLALAASTRCRDKLFGAADFQYLRGEILRTLGRNKEAMTHYRLAAQLNVYFGLPHLRMAQIEDARGQLARALDHYRSYLSRCVSHTQSDKRAAQIEKLLR